MSYKLKVAVGVNGNIVALEKFPDEERHAGLNDMIEDLEGYFETDETPGVYLATISIDKAESNKYNDPTDDVFLVIEAMSPLNLY